MSEIVFKCRRHGNRTEEQVYRSNDKATAKGFRYKCKECTYGATSRRPCKVHGDIPSEARYPSGKCRICSFNELTEYTRIHRNENRTDFNEKQRLKREANPEAWANAQKRKHAANVERHGREKINHNAKAQRLKLTPEQLTQMFIDQDNKCAICKQPETRIFTSMVTKEQRVASLCIDHDHATGKVRELLCHDCNTMIGKAKESIDNLQSAIQYLIKHQE